jgi:hypothetical protein
MLALDSESRIYHRGPIPSHPISAPGAAEASKVLCLVEVRPGVSRPPRSTRVTVSYNSHAELEAEEGGLYLM